jgi:hypothetical protein
MAERYAWSFGAMRVILLLDAVLIARCRLTQWQMGNAPRPEFRNPPDNDQPCQAERRELRRQSSRAKRD